MEGARWYKVYDIAEALYAKLVANGSWDSRPADEFERRLNDFFVGNGIGWELRDGQITHKGSRLSTRALTKCLTAWKTWASNAQRTKCARP